MNAKIDRNTGEGQRPKDGAQTFLYVYGNLHVTDESRKESHVNNYLRQQSKILAED
jgi:hypothetical protein